MTNDSDKPTFVLQQIKTGFILLLLHSFFQAAPVQAAEQIFSARDISAGNQQFESITTGRDAILKGTSVSGNIQVGRSLKAQHCRIQNQLTVGRDATLDHCTLVSNIQAGRNLILENTTVEHDVEAGRQLKLLNAVIKGNASAGGAVEIRNSKIGNTLSAAAPYLALHQATLNHLHLHQPYSAVQTQFSTPVSRQTVFSNQGVVVTGRVHNSVLQHHGGKATVAVGAHSVSHVNGYTVKSTEQQTTVLTPHGAIYVNGHKVSGEGPAQYEQFRAAHSEAPSIEGPGWSSGALVTGHQKLQENGFVQIVELFSNSHIQGNITFESGQGKVIVHPGSKFEGQVHGGTVDYL